MKRIFYTSIALLFLFVCFLDVGVVKSRVLYDDFSGISINEQKWADADNMPLDFVRKVNGGKLISKVGNSTITENARNNTAFNNPSLINVIECEISVGVATLDSGINPKSLARVDGRFYNAQNSGTQRGDIWVSLNLGNRGSGLEAWWEVYEATDDDGTSWDEKGSGPLTIPGPFYDQSYTVKIDYDGANEFTFTVAGVSSPFTGPDWEGPEFIAYKALETVVYADGGAGNGYVSASFDNVFTNDSAYDDFSTAPLDQTNWQYTEFGREIDNGKLQLSTHSTGDRERTRLTFTQSSPYIEATVTVKNESWFNPGTKGRIRLRGTFYNDTYGPGSGRYYDEYTGEIYAYVAIHYYGDTDSLEAIYNVERWDDPTAEEYTILLGEAFAMSITKGQAYTISIRLTDTELIFTCKNTATADEEIVVYPIETDVYIPFDYNWKQIESRIDPGSAGYMVTEIDDVYAEAATYDSPGDMLLTITDIWNSEDCDGPPELPITLDTTFEEQIGNEFTWIIYDFWGDDDGRWNGNVYGGTYTFGGAEFDEDYIGIINSQFKISQGGSGLGFWKLYELNEGQECRELVYFSVNIKDIDKDGYDSTMYGGDDCDDNNPLIFPDAEEICGDNMDNNCNGQVDEDCSVLCGDANGDGFVDRIDLKAKFRELNNEYIAWRNECWTTKEPCGDFDGNGRVNWRDRTKKYKSLLKDYFAWIQECWRPQRG